LQIAGGIWADTVGGKTVLGFGVVWWSIATALTPIAAQLGLPFLLVVRAFMGIGEVSLSYSWTYIYSFLIQVQKLLEGIK
jgi:MFS family permease